MTVSLRLRALANAQAELGVKEHPPGSNWGPRVSLYLRSAGVPFPAPWCLAFVHWCYAREGRYLGGKALVQAFDNWATQNGDIVKRPLRGDIFCADWNNDHWDDHTGFVEKVLALRWRGEKFTGWIRTVEGNTAVGNDSNGGEVMRRWRWCNTSSFKFVRIPD